MTHSNCKKHQYRLNTEILKSIGRVRLEVCNNCLSVTVIQKRDTDDNDTRTVVEMKDSAYPYVK